VSPSNAAFARGGDGNIKYLREGTLLFLSLSLSLPPSPPWRFSRVSQDGGVYACLVTGTMSRRLSTMGFADITTLATNPLRSPSATPRPLSSSAKRKKERKKEPAVVFFSPLGF